MALPKIKKPSGFNFKDLTPIKLKKGIKLEEHNPDHFLKNPKLISKALAEAMFDGDVHSFKDILSAYIRVTSKDEIAKKTGISRATVFRMLDHNSNPSFENVLKVVRTLKIVV